MDLSVYPVTAVLSTAVLLFAVLLYRARTFQGSLPELPILQFEKGDNSAGRYLRETKKLLHVGYIKYTKYGLPFRMRNPVDPDLPLVILPWKYLDEVKNAPMEQLSFPRFSKQAFLLDYNHGPQQTDAAALVVRTDLNKHLNNLLAGLQEECKLALDSKMPECKDWMPIQPYMTLAYAIARVATRFLAGTELSRNDEWVQMNIQITMITHRAAQEIRKQYPPGWRWLARWRHPGAKVVMATKRRAAQLIAPVLRKRLGSERTESGDPDGIQWFLAIAGNRGKTAEELASEHLFLGITSIHSTTASTLSIIYDLLDHSDAMKEIFDEIQTVQAECQGGLWTRSSLLRLEKLDSFMKESQRVNPLGCLTVQRSSVKPYTFKDGFQVPKDTHMAFLNYELNHDPDIYEDAEVFNPWRFYNMRRAEDPNKFHFTYVSHHSINFGAGTHACPGRFFASHEIKLILVYILTRYDIRWPEGGGRPPNMAHDFADNPDPTADIMFRSKRLK